MTTDTTSAPGAQPADAPAIDRRAFLGAVPAVAVAAAVPAVALANTDRSAWEPAKAAYAAAIRREDAAGRAHNALEEALIDTWAEPRRDIRYKLTVRGVTFDAIHTLTPNDCDNPDPDWAGHPGLAGFQAEAAAWRDRVASERQRLNADAIEEEWADAVDARVEAFRALATCPAPTVAVLAEKATFCGTDDTRQCDGCQDLLIQSLAADARRLAGEAA